MVDLDNEHENLEMERVTVRTLAPEDLPWVVRIDEAHTGHSRRPYYEIKLREAQVDTAMRISLAATVDGEPAGFVLARLYYGEFGMPEPTAILDSIGIAPMFSKQAVGRALIEKLKANLAALHIERIETVVEWNHTDLIGFFNRCGFEPASRLCLELDINKR